MRKTVILLILALLVIIPLNPAFSFDTDYRFTGQELDSATNIYYYGQRHYQPDIGRFTQPDPVLRNFHDPQKLRQQTGQDLEGILSNPQALNEYNYTQNNPVKYIDPEGESIRDIQEYVVKTGDTLNNLFAESWGLVAQYNNLSTPDLIYPGQELLIPSGVQINCRSDFLTDLGRLSLSTATVLAKNTVDLFIGQGVGDIAAGLSGANNLTNALDRSLSSGERITEAITGAVKLGSSLSVVGGKALGFGMKVNLKNIGIHHKTLLKGTQLIHIGREAINGVKGVHMGIGKVHVFFNPVKMIKYIKTIL